MDRHALDRLRCPFCGTRLAPVDNAALRVRGDTIEAGVVGCECCAYPIVDGIPVLVADEVTREAMHTLEDGRPEAARDRLLGLTGARVETFRALLAAGRPTYRGLLPVLCLDAEADYCLHRFADATYRTAEALVATIGRHDLGPGAALDLCGGTGHLTRALMRHVPRAGGPVLADRAYWKLWLATRITAPGCVAVCCDANSPLPFARNQFAVAVLADAFPYIWHKRMLADEMMRVTTAAGVIAMPHLHSARGENVSAGDALTPAAYRDLFAPRAPRLFDDARLLAGVVRDGVVDLAADTAPDALGRTPSLTLVASGEPRLYARLPVDATPEVGGVLAFNPLYRIEPAATGVRLTLRFPTAEYAAEFGPLADYLPAEVTVAVDPTGPLTPESVGSDYTELRRRRVLLDVPPGYC